ncbi:MAG: dynamin family protein [Aeromonas sp.]
MNNIEIIHNPFIVDTQFIIDGEPSAESSPLLSFKESRLQLWVEQLFASLSEACQGSLAFNVSFKGVEADYLDLCEAANVARARGMQIELSWQEVASTEDRLAQIRQLIALAHENSKFHRFITETDDVRLSIDEAFNKDFDVYVIATMSSGKSTLINAMLGTDLLPAANEATTATIARITDNDAKQGVFSGKRFNQSGQLVDEHSDLHLDTLREWNKLEDTKLIDIEGDIVAIKERDHVRLVLTDTPGPNNSQDIEHQRTTMGFIQDTRRNPLILYVLNAQQLGTNDDSHLLKLVAEMMQKGGKQSKDRFIFVVNKMDVFDPENNEQIPSVINRIHKYLLDNGISNPLLYPVSANLTRLLRKPQEKHTRAERGEFSKLVDLFSEEPSMNLLQYMPVTSRVKQTLAAKNYDPLLLASGLPAVEAMIDEYIDKYNLPHRLKRAYDAISKAIDIGLNEANLIKRLEQDEQALAQLNQEIHVLQQRQKRGFDTAAYKEKVALEGKNLPSEILKELSIIESNIQPVLRHLQSRFLNKKVPVATANSRISDAEIQLQFHYQKAINAYDNLLNTSQKMIKQDLYEEYQRYIAEIFQDSKHFNLPVMAGLKRMVQDISFNLSINSYDVKRRQVKTGSREVSTAKWFNPFSWGKKKTVNEYIVEEFVDLESLWQERVVRVESEFDRLTGEARAEIETAKNCLIDQFVDFMNQEFDIKFNKLLSDLEARTNDKVVREQAIMEAKQQQEWIEDLKQRLNNTLAV